MYWNTMIRYLVHQHCNELGCCAGLQDVCTVNLWGWRGIDGLAMYVQAQHWHTLPHWLVELWQICAEKWNGSWVLIAFKS